MERFEGFADADAKFFKALAKNQKREWFLARKDEFEQGYNRPMKLLLQELHAAIDAAYPHCDLEAPKVFRIFRDVRFSKDKSPYKDHVAGYIGTKRAGKGANAPAAVYVHVGVETFAAAGHYMMEGTALERFREAVADDARGKVLARILAKLEKQGYRTESHDALKRVPKGFDPGHPRAALLKRKGLVVTFPQIPKKLVASRKLVDWLTAASEEVAPLVEWLVFATA